MRRPPPRPSRASPLLSARSGRERGTASGSTEAVQYSTCYEPWIAQLLAGVTNPAAGFQVYVDNGSGTASTALLTAVAAELDGDFATGAEGNRPAGVPYTVNVVNPVNANGT